MMLWARRVHHESGSHPTCVTTSCHVGGRRAGGALTSWDELCHGCVEHPLKKESVPVRRALADVPRILGQWEAIGDDQRLWKNSSKSLALISFLLDPMSTPMVDSSSFIWRITRA